MKNKEEKILKSALELFSKEGFHGASTAAIAQEAGVSNGILFHYFNSKDKLIQQLHLSILNDQINSLYGGVGELENPKEKIQLIWNQSIGWAIKNESKHNFLQQYKYSPYKKKQKGSIEGFRKDFAEIIEKGIQQKAIRYLPDDFIYEMLSANIYGMVDYLRKNPVKFRTPEFMKQAFENFWNSVKA